MVDQVPREFVGQAREFFRQLAADDVVAQRETRRITTSLGPVIRAGGTLRPQQLARASIAWTEKIPVTGRLRLEIDLKKKSLHIRELRAIAAETIFDGWAENETEPGIALAARKMEVIPDHFGYDPILLAGISLHALGRWFQRSFHPTRAALLTDLQALAMGATDTRLGTPGEFEVAAGDGKWAGVVMKNRDGSHVLATRSFLNY